MPVPQANIAQVTELVMRAKEGDRLAFDRLVELHAPAVYNLARRVTRSQDEAEDCVQEAFLRAYTGLRNFRGEAAFSTWLYRVALNVAREAAKKRARAPLLAADLTADNDGEPPDLGRLGRPSAATGPSPEEAVAQNQRRQVVREAVAGLPLHHREVIVLFDLQGLSYEEIATVLQVRVGTVKSRLNRARLALREALVGQMELLRE